MTDEKAPRAGSRRETATEPQTEPQGQALPVGEDEAGRTKVPRLWVIENGERVLGIQTRDLVSALGEDEREELTINAVRKAVDEYRAKSQNPEEG